MKKRIQGFVFLCLIMTVCACGGGSSSKGIQPETLQRRDINVDGAIQKGPFVHGSKITIQELDGSLNPNGSVFITYTRDDLGRFSIPITVTSRYIEVVAEGYYFNEVTGVLSDGPLLLKTISEVTSDGQQRVNVNILTTLAYDRTKALFKNAGISFADSKLQACSEILKVFGIEKSMVAEGDVSFEKMDLSSGSSADAVLIAVSAILQSHDSVGELAERIAKISADVETDGILNDAAYRERILASSSELDVNAIYNNLKGRYASMGEAITIPPFAGFIDSDRSGYIDLLESAPVQFSRGSGEYSAAMTVELTTITPGAAIYYTLDGTNPSENSPLYSGPITVAGDGTSLVITAFATSPGRIPSRVSSCQYRINYPKAEEPHFSHLAGVYAQNFLLQLTRSQSGAIYYTLDGSTPTEKSTLYSGSGIPINGDGNVFAIKAIAIQEGRKISDVATSYYRINYAYTYPYETAALDMSAYRAAVIGTWIGYVQTPWTGPYNVIIRFDADGTCTPTSLTSAKWGSEVYRFPAFYYGVDNARLPYRLDDINASGQASGSLVIFDTRPGTIRNLSFNSDLSALEFQYWHGNYGPLQYRLLREF